MTGGAYDFITPEQAGTLAGLFAERVRRSADAVAYREYDPSAGLWREYTWAQTAARAGHHQAALEGEGLAPGDRVAVMLRNCHEWVAYDQAALGLGLVVVPLYVEDRPENTAYILRDAGARVLLIEGAEQWEALRAALVEVPDLQRVVTRTPVVDSDARLRALAHWLPREDAPFRVRPSDPAALATIVYTSGTTGRPKGVMLSHRNLLTNAYGCLGAVPATAADTLLSFLPLSHTLERTVGYYLAVMSGAMVAYARSIRQLAEDLEVVRPTVLISVPRIYERVHNRLQAQLVERPAFARALFAATVRIGWTRFLHRQGRGPWRVSFLLWPLLERLVARKVMQRLGGRMRVAVCGGAPLALEVARVFIGLGLELLQGYGLTEASPVITANRAADNDPASVGTPLDGVQVRIGADGEILARGPNVMLGYWNQPEATAQMIDSEGWLHTGDTARIEDGHVYITGRIKEIIVLANGEKVPPADMELAIALDPLFEQIMVLGEGRPYLSALAVLNGETWHGFAAELGLDPKDPETLLHDAVQSAVLERIGRRLASFPGYAQVRCAALLLEPWTIEADLMTPTLKLRRARILEHHADRVAALYEGH